MDMRVVGLHADFASTADFHLFRQQDIQKRGKVCRAIYFF